MGADPVPAPPRTLIETCELKSVDPFAYLTAVVNAVVNAEPG